MDARFPVIDVFRILEHRRPRPIWQVLRVATGRIPKLPGDSPWGFPFGRPTSGVDAGPASGGGRRGIPQGSQPVGRIGRFFGPPEAM